MESIKKVSKLPKGSQMLKALGDESRIRILNLILANEEMCVSDLESILEFTQTKTSRHISYLKNSGLLRAKKTDQWVYYHISNSYLDVIKRIFTFFENDSQLRKDLQEYRTLYSNNILAIRKLHNQQNKFKLPELI